MPKWVILPAAVAAGLSLAACGSTTVKSGTETFSGSTASTANSPTVPLKASGVFADTGSIYLADSNSLKGTFKLSDGNLYVTHSKGVQRQTVSKTCVAVFTETGTYVVTGGTGTYKGAAGGVGTYKVTFSATLPKLADGKCNEAQSAQPVKGTSLTVFHATGPVKVK
jgi:hypothetical protein